MKKTLIFSFILTCIFIFAPAFIVDLDSDYKENKNVNDVQIKNLKKYLICHIHSILVDKKGNIIEVEENKQN